MNIPGHLSDTILMQEAQYSPFVIVYVDGYIGHFQLLLG